MLTANDIMRDDPLTPAELAYDRERVVRLYAREGISISTFTCDDCAARFKCKMAFDVYNTDGDCLAEK